MKPRYVLGISMSNHDRAACLLADGRVVGAVAEERLDRRKGSEGFYRRGGSGIVLPPVRAVTRLLRDEGVDARDLELVVCGRSIARCRDDLLAQLPFAPDRVVEPEPPAHHLAHAYSAYATSPSSAPAVLVIDEQGHWIDGRFERCSWFVGDGGPLRRVRSFQGDRRQLSLGMFYNVFAAVTGLSEAGRPAAGKLMSLAAYGREHKEWPELLECRPDGDVDCAIEDVDAFLARAAVPMQHGMEELPALALDDLLGRYRRIPWSSALAADLARKAQDELQRAILHTAGLLRSVTGRDELAFAGGVALNCATNAHLGQAGWRDVHVHPAATDDGTALGLAYYGWIEVLGQPRTVNRRFSPLLGPRHTPSEHESALDRYGLAGRYTRATPEDAAEVVATDRILCWYTGRSEWGPRALGARSIVANPLRPDAVKHLNATVKHREPFRPFGVSIPAPLLERLLTTTEPLSGLAPYMLTTATATNPALAAVAHRDGTIRYQAVDEAEQPQWFALICETGRRTGLDAVINTSFNVLGEPLVESPGDAVRQFLTSGADALYLDGRLLLGADVPAESRERAWEQTPVAPAQAAAVLAANGHPAAAARLLEQRSVEARDFAAAGHSALSSYHALCMRALRDADEKTALEHAEAVLDLWTFPADVREAAGLLAAAEGRRHQLLACLLASLAPGGSAEHFFQALLPARTRQ